MVGRKDEAACAVVVGEHEQIFAAGLHEHLIPRRSHSCVCVCVWTSYAHMCLHVYGSASERVPTCFHIYLALGAVARSALVSPLTDGLHAWIPACVWNRLSNMRIM